MMFTIRAILTLVLGLGFLVPAYAAVTPLSFAIIPPVQFPPSDFSVTGIRLSAGWGRHRDVYGIDIGLIGNITEQTHTGISASGLFNYTKGNVTALGFQLAGGANVNMQKTTIIGLQAALIANYNNAESSVNGVQLSLANISDHTHIRGVQIGLYNTARTVYGFQIGLINMTENLYGLQIGLMNFHHSGIFPVAPFLNVGF